MYIFTDGSFANNKDLTSQLEFVIVLAIEISRTEADFEIFGNIIHWSSTKCKRVTRSVVASELYGMMTGFDSGIALSTTLNQIMECLAVPRIPVVIRSDSRSLYECLVKLGTTDENAEQKTEDIEVQVATVSTISKRPMPLGFYSQSQPVSS
jgi:hypothetical protein